MEQRKQLGNDSERLARKFLERQGYRLVQSNFRSKWGEIDLIMRKGQELIFVEVRSKSTFRYGQPTGNYKRQQAGKNSQNSPALSLSASRIRAMLLPV